MSTARGMLWVAPLGAALVAACGSSPPRQADSARPAASADPWDHTPHRAEWLYATGDVSGSHPKECEHVLGVLRAEEPCVGATCAHAHALAEDWLARCPRYLGDAAGEVKELDARWRTAQREPADACGAEAEAMLRDGCGKDRTCVETSQQWATRCGEKRTTPLVVRMVERAVERRSGERRVKLDVRSCDAMRAEVAKAARCAHRFQCADALEGVETWRKRCEAAEPKSLLEALLPRVVLAAAEQPDPAPVTLPREGAKLVEGQLPLTLADGSGAVVSVCGERVLDVDAYLAAREKCQGGSVALVRAWTTSARTVEVRAAKLAFADARAFERTYPEILVAGEREARDARDAKAFAAELDEAGKLAATSPGDAVAAVVRAIAPRARALGKPGALREVLTAHDDALAPALREIGARKLKATKGKLAIAELLGVVQRGASAALADLDASGAVQPGAGALELDTVEALPVATAAYRQALAPAHKLVRGKNIDVKALRLAIEQAGEAAVECGVHEKKVDEIEHRLLACAAGRETCDDDLAASLDKSRASAESARAKVIAAMTGIAVAEKDRIADATAQAGCLEPWW